MSTINTAQRCPCLSNKPYQSCCQPLHDGILYANSALQLMGSRYSAFYLGNINYLINTLLPDNRQVNDGQTLTQTIKQTNWLGLKILSHKQNGSSAMVDFVAFFKDESVEQSDISQLHELSHFIKKEERWFYVDGEFLAPIKIMRNEPCFCNRGKKFKKCHGT